MELASKATADRLIGRIKGVLFDLDDTLYDRRAAFREWGLIFLRERLRVDEAECAKVMGWMESLDANGYGSKHTIIIEMCRRFPEAKGSVEGFYDEFVERVSLDSETTKVLAHLESRRIPYGVVTNGTERQWRKIDALGLRQRTQTILVSETFGAKKPEEAIFLAAAKSIDIAPSQVLFVGDHPVNDVTGARSSGMLTAWLHRDRPWPPELQPADVTISSLDELLPLLP
jgi:putative hydrolase of the HAD superfamily